MRWTYENFTTMLLGLVGGLWISGWLALINPVISLFISVPVAFWVLWRASNIMWRHREAQQNKEQ